MSARKGTFPRLSHDLHAPPGLDALTAVSQQKYHPAVFIMFGSINPLSNNKTRGSYLAEIGNICILLPWAGELQESDLSSLIDRVGPISFVH